jgi:hypothetical protein
VNTGHDLRLKSKTEKITPKDAPRVLRMRRVLRQWSHCKIAYQLLFFDRMRPSSHCLYSFSLSDFVRVPTFSFKRASLMGLLGRTEAAVMGALVLESAIVRVS